MVKNRPSHWEYTVNDQSATDLLEQLDLATLKTVLACYKHVKRHGALYFSEIQKQLPDGTSIDQVNRRIRKFERAVNQQRFTPVSTSKKDTDNSTRNEDAEFRLFERRRGGKARLPEENEQVERQRDLVMLAVTEIIEASERISSVSERMLEVEVSLAMSMSALRYFLPKLIAKFPEYRFDASHGKPRRLQDIAMLGKCDFVLAAITEDFRCEKGRRLWKGKLQMALLAARGSWLEREVEPRELTAWARSKDGEAPGYDLWEKVREKKNIVNVVRDEPDRSPSPAYPAALSEAGIVVNRLGSTMICQSLVGASALTPSPNALAIGMPQFLTDADHQFIYVVNAGLASVKYGLFQARANDSEGIGHDSRRTEAVRAVGKFLASEMRALEAMKFGVDSNADQTAPSMKYVYHLTYVDDVRTWTFGKMWWSRRPAMQVGGESEIIDGSHRTSTGEKHYQFFFHGRVTKFAPDDEDGPRHLCLYCQMDNQHSYDEYVMSAVLKNGGVLDDGVFVGTWTGVSAWGERGTSNYDDDAKDVWVRPLSGCVVVSSYELTLTDLNERAQDYLRYSGVANLLTKGETLADNAGI